MLRNVRLSLVAASLCLCLSPAALAANTGSQTFSVVVPTSISITAPAAVTLTHDESDNPQAFPAQTWTVRGNNATGVTVSFATANAFTHSTNPAFKRNARLGLSLGTVQGGQWTVTVPTDETNIANNDEIAQVTASSVGAGRANFNLAVTFVTEEFGVFAAGNYATTVVGTVSAN